MSIIKWDPWREVQDMFDRYTRAVGKPRIGSHEGIEGSDWVPRVDVAETEKEYVIKAELPEVEKEDVSVTLDDRILTLSGERNLEREEKGKKFHLVERHYGKFSRSFTLPDNIEESGVKAQFKDGLLTLRIAKTEAAKSKVVKVKVE